MAVVKVQYMKDEVYPVYIPVQHERLRYVDGEVEVNKTLYNRWVHVMRQFNEVQDEIQKAVDGEGDA